MCGTLFHESFSLKYRSTVIMFCCIEDKVRFKELQSYFIVQMNAWGWVVAIIQKSRLLVYNSLILVLYHYFFFFFPADYQGLTRSFCYGKIYCSSITASLVNMKIGIPWDRLQVLPLNQKINIAGIDVTCLDANHCPGSIMILFEPPNGKVWSWLTS